jgi:hypothetical protein
MERPYASPRHDFGFPAILAEIEDLVLLVCLH